MVVDLTAIKKGLDDAQAQALKIKSGVDTLASNPTPPAQTTLAQDQAKAGNQGKPGFDTLGNPVAPSSTGGTPSPYYSRVSGAPMDAASTYLNTFQAPQSEADIYAQKLKESQGLIDAINAKYDATLGDLKKEGASNLSATNSQNISAGLMGSPDAGKAYNDTAVANDKTYAANAAARQAEISGVLTTVSDNATKQAQYEESQARLSAEDAVKFREQMITDATNSIKTLASGGVDLNAYKTQAPDNYAALVKQAGGDENAVAAQWALSRPQNTVVDSKTVGNTYYQVTKNPLTGAITTEHFDLGFAVPQDYNVPQVDRTNGVVVWTPKQIDPSKPLADQVIVKSYGISPQNQQLKDLTLQAKIQTIQAKGLSMQRTSQMIESSKAMEATRIVGSQIKSDATIQNFLKIQPLMDAVDADYAEITKGNLNEETAARMLDTITRLNTGGQAITAGQANLTQENQSYIDQAKVLGQKISGAGGVIDEKVAKDMADLAKKTYTLYKTQYQNHIKTYDSRLKNVAGQDLTQYSPLTDISNLPAVVNGSYEKSIGDSLNAGMNANTTDSSSSSTDLTGLGATDNGDGTFSLPDGTTVMDNGDGTYTQQ